ncbi:hypothetical protein B0H67DRAFT_475264 [Lasiosphaeris hirsuta]|uniref:Nudix hydrolase domain-containing protein n=1 Tax=Lasiosphaeris hirsuta TaxID=260670 RepID=A0AA40ECH0_9PEZI|nr:hypothetical protein B0H67DRAFT_475264 [Lasiosphaeris hirsuta]
MTSFQHPDYDVPVKVLPEGLSKEQILNFHPFSSWLTTLHNSLTLQTKDHGNPFYSDPYCLRSITVQAHDMFGLRLGFLKLTAEISNSANEKLPGAVFLRGPSVAMLVMLIPADAPNDTDERYVLLTVQPRIAAGSLAFVELPAGMVDDAGTFAGAAAKEMQEELGLEIPAGQLKCLSDLANDVPEPGSGNVESEGGKTQDGNLPRGVYPSPGGCDEFIPIFMHERRVPRAQMGEWTGRLTGLREQGERITLKLVPMRDLWREGARDAKCLAALALWEGLRKEGKV